MEGVLVSGMGRRLELEGAVLDVEMAGQALGQPVEHSRTAPVGEGGICDDDVGGEDREAAGHSPGV